MDLSLFLLENKTVHKDWLVGETEQAQEGWMENLKQDLSRREVRLRDLIDLPKSK